MSNMKESATRAAASGIAGGLLGMATWGDGGSRPLPVLGTPVPSSVFVGAACGVGSVASDVVQNITADYTPSIGSNPTTRKVVGLATAGLVSGWVMQNETPGSFTENAIVGALAYAAGDWTTAKVYTSPGRIF